MRSEQIMIYTCEKCGKQFLNAKKAYRCERMHGMCTVDGLDYEYDLNDFTGIRYPRKISARMSDGTTQVYVWQRMLEGIT